MIRARSEWITRKRDGRTVPFESRLIYKAIGNAFRAELNLAENQPLIDDIFSRIADFAQNIFGEPMMEVHRGFKNIGRAVYASSKSSSRTPEQIRRIKEILDRAASEIEGI